MFLTRLLSGIVLVILTATSLVFGGTYLFLLMLLISIIGMTELYKIYGIEKSILGFGGYFSAIIYYLSIYFDFGEYSYTILVISLIILMTIYVFTYPKYKVEQVTMGFFAIVYVAVMLSFIYRIRVMNDGVLYVWLVYVCSWGNDTCAYLAGRAFGKHKMSPKLSPKKTVEGAIGGILGSVLLGFIYAMCIKNNLTVDNAILAICVASAGGAALSIVGDLAASAIKRSHNVKDYGKLIPGHGGILDRYDSVVFTAPAVYFLLILLG